MSVRRLRGKGGDEGPDEVLEIQGYSQPERPEIDVSITLPAGAQYEVIVSYRERIMPPGPGHTFLPHWHRAYSQRRIPDGRADGINGINLRVTERHEPVTSQVDDDTEMPF